MPAPLVHALGMVKQAAALVNQDLGALDPKVAEAVAASAAEVVSGEHDQEFPLVVADGVGHPVEHERQPR